MAMANRVRDVFHSVLHAEVLCPHCGVRTFLTELGMQYITFMCPMCGFEMRMENTSHAENRPE